MIGAVAGWLYVNVLGNEVASLLALAAAWFWKVRPHLVAQRRHQDEVARHVEHERQHRLNVEHWLAGLHDRHDELAARLDALGAPATRGTGAHGYTDTFAAVGGERDGR